MVTINRYYSVQQAYIDKAYLESEGISAIIFDSNLSGYGPFGAQIIGGIRLQVDDHNANRAKQILEEHSISTKSDIALQCPKCNGFDTRTENHISFTNAYRRVLFGEKKPVFYHVHCCNDCNHLW